MRLRKIVKMAKRVLALQAVVALGMVVPLAAVEAAPAGPNHDSFYWLGQINKASIVINAEEGLYPKAEAPEFARALNRVLKDGDNGGPRPNLVITFEPLLIKAGGQEITKIHAGRSSQDMLAASRYSMTKEDLLQLGSALDRVSATLIDLAEANRDTIVPSYTNGVAAQPTSYGHYLLAFASGLSRDSDRLQEYYKRLDRSPMGTTVLNGTSWPLNRKRMADYLGFETIAYNAFDAVQIFAMENAVEEGYVCTSLALHIGDFIEDVMQQYAQPRPWILLQEGGANTYVSSAMPQKRNPGILNRARTDAGTIIGLANGAIMRSHNIPYGMADARMGMEEPVGKTTKLLNNFDTILKALRVNPERGLEELNLDWTSSQELADVLMRKYQVPFRVGHHFASEMVGFARQQGYTPKSFPYAEAQRIYKQVIGAEGAGELPMSEAEFRSTMDPVSIVHNRATVGGPQPAELTKMLGQERAKLAKRVAWNQSRTKAMQSAEARLNSDFEALLK